jgi:hypothetical protein
LLHATHEKKVTQILPIALACFLVPVMSFAQSGIAGRARDTSGAVLPGVTVEASGPALIEQTRNAVTDGAGAYRIALRLQSLRGRSIRPPL